MSGGPKLDQTGLLGDTKERDYSAKLRLFNRFAEPELRECIRRLGLRPGMRVLDAGCGTGETLNWLWNEVQPGGEVFGLDLATAHVAAARLTCPAATVLQADLLQPALPAASFDLVWCANTINHVREPDAALRALRALVRPGGRIALAQGSLLPEMFFAWDLRLERLIHEAVRRFYLERYGLNERDLGPIRAILGLLRAAQLREVRAQSILIERLSPLEPASETYISEAIFRDTWGERLRPYLDADDYQQLRRLTDASDSEFALRRPDFHFLQTFSVVTGRI